MGMMRFVTIALVSGAMLHAESKLRAKLPGSETAASEVNFADEKVIVIQNDDSLLLDGGAVTSETLRAELQRFIASKGNVLVTVATEPEAQYSMTVRVMDLLKELKIENVTFTVSEDSAAQPSPLPP
jgi:biopolymer transport protein ExbD